MSGLFVDNDGRWSWQKLGYHARSAFAVVLSLAILIGAGVIAEREVKHAYIAYKTINDYLGPGKGSVIVTIPTGAGITEMGGILLDADVVKSMKAWKSAANANPDFAKIQAGKYKLPTEIPAATAVMMLLDPKNVQRTYVSLIEGWRLTDAFARLSKVSGVPVAQFNAIAVKPPASLGLPSWSNHKLEGFLFPNTYAVGDNPTALQLVTQAVTQFNSVASSANLVKGAASLKYSPLAVVTVASIVQKETSNPKYMPLVAEVIYNRLAKGMKLQSDATIIYATNSKGTLTTTNAQRAVNSPYNTYLHTGLPPGPIGNPGKDAITAALHPSTGTYLFFTAVDPGTGETRFETTVAEHDADVKLFQGWCQAHPGKC